MSTCPDSGDWRGLRGLGLLLLLSTLTLPTMTACRFERSPREGVLERDDGAEVPSEEIKQMLRSSAASWNRGDLAGFLDDYWNSDELTFSGSGGVTRGWEQVRSRYEQSYWAPGAVRDSLSFEDLEVFPLGSDHALALGRYVLHDLARDGGISGTGYFSLVLRRTEEGWRIIHDHTSASPDSTQEGNGHP